MKFRYLYFFLIIFCWYDFFEIDIMGLNDYAGIQFSKIIAIALVIMGLFNRRTVDRMINPGFYGRSVYTIFILVLFPILVVGMMVYQQSLWHTFTSTIFFWGYLIFFFLQLHFEKEEDTVVLYRTMILGGFISIAIVLLLNLFPDIQEFFVERLRGLRFGQKRVVPKIAPELVMFFIVYLITKAGLATGLKNKLKYTVFFVMVSALLIESFQTRSLILTLLILYGYTLVREGIKTKYIALNLLLITTALFFFIGRTEIYSYNLESIYNEYSESSGTIGIRFQAMRYYFHYFIDTYLVGFGMYSLKEANPISYGLAHYNYNLNDIGILDILFRFGLAAMVFLFFMIYRMLRDCRPSFQASTEVSEIKMVISNFIVLEILTFPFSKMLLFHKSSLFWGIILFLLSRLSSGRENG